MRLLKLGNATTIPKLNEERAIETGSQLLSELIILGIASGMLVYEYQRSSEKEEAKKEQLEREKAYLNDKLEHLGAMLDKQREDIKELTAISKRLQDEIAAKNRIKKKRLTQEAPEVKEVSFEDIDEDIDELVCSSTELLPECEIFNDYNSDMNIPVTSETYARFSGPG